MRQMNKNLIYLKSKLVCGEVCGACMCVRAYVRACDACVRAYMGSWSYSVLDFKLLNVVSH